MSVLKEFFNGLYYCVVKYTRKFCNKFFRRSLGTLDKHLSAWDKRLSAWEEYYNNYYNYEDKE